MKDDSSKRPVLFLAALFVVGAAVRFGGAIGGPAAPDRLAAEQGLVRQLAAAESARLATAGGSKRVRDRGRQPGRANGREAATRDADGSLPSAPEGVPPEVAAAAGWYWRPTDAAAPRPAGASTARPSASVPGSARSGAGPSGAPPDGRRTRGAPPAPDVLPVDLDVAEQSAIEALPGVGPALAARIVADRAWNGPFGGLRGLDRVPGVGPALLQRLAPFVTFSTVARPGDAVPPAVAPSGGSRRRTRA